MYEAEERGGLHCALLDSRFPDWRISYGQSSGSS